MTLCFRLEDYERNFNFKVDTIEIKSAAHTDPEWPRDSFKSLTIEHLVLMPIIERSIICQWLTQAGNNQALKKGLGLQKSDRVMTCSLLIKEQEYYFSCICRAAMKKKVQPLLLLNLLLVSMTAC